MGDGSDEYGDQESSNSESGYGSEEEEDEGELYMTLQPNESKDIMMEPARKEMMLYLQKDDVHGWKFKNKQIKNYVKSLSFDMCDTAEPGPDEQSKQKPVAGALDFNNDTSDQQIEQ